MVALIDCMLYDTMGTSQVHRKTTHRLLYVLYSLHTLWRLAVHLLFCNIKRIIYGVHTCIVSERNALIKTLYRQDSDSKKVDRAIL